MQIMLFQQVIVIIHTQFLLFLYLSIRNIIGQVYLISSYDTPVNIGVVAAFEVNHNYVENAAKGNTTGTYSYGRYPIRFQASNNTLNPNHPIYNPMAGHTGDEIKPATILALPIYIY